MFFVSFFVSFFASFFLRYLLLLRLLHRDYAAAFRLAESVATDSHFDDATRLIWLHLAIANDDLHPDCLACRHKLALVTVDSAEQLPWDLTINQFRYSVRLGHISCECRMTKEEELQLLHSESMVFGSESPAYNRQIHTIYKTTIVKNRLTSLSAQAAAAHAATAAGVTNTNTNTGLVGVPNNGSNGSRTALARVWHPPRNLGTSWPYYQDNTVFGERYNEVLRVYDAEDLEGKLRDSADGALVQGGPMLTLIGFYVSWAAGSLKAEKDIEGLAPSIPFVKFLSVRADQYDDMNYL